MTSESLAPALPHFGHTDTKWHIRYSYEAYKRRSTVQDRDSSRLPFYLADKMRISALLVTDILAIAVLGAVADTNTTQVINNYCPDRVFFTYTNGSGHVFLPPTQLNSGEAYISPVVGLGDSYGITNTTDYYGDPKLVLGTSVDEDGRLWWVRTDIFSLSPMLEISAHTSPASHRLLATRVQVYGQKRDGA